jgi:glucose/arabinose dehydrogenase
MHTPIHHSTQPNFMNPLLTNLFSRALLVALLVSLFSQCTKQNTLPSADPDNGGLFLPDNFSAVVVVDSLDGRARHLTVNDNGDIYVKARFADTGTSVIALRDTNADGKADIIKKFGGSGKERAYGTGARIHNGYLYFSSELVVYRYKLTPGKLVPESEMEIVLTDDHPHGMHEHIAKPLAFDDQGNMYVAFGAPSNACQEINRTPNSPGIYPCPHLEDHGGIWRFSADKLGQTTKDGVKYATGLRSVVAMDWNPEDGNLYAANHGRDDLLRLWANKYTPWQSAVYPSEEFFMVREGLNGGWPYYFYDQINNKRIVNPEYEGMEDRIPPAKWTNPLWAFRATGRPTTCFSTGAISFRSGIKKAPSLPFTGPPTGLPIRRPAILSALCPSKTAVRPANGKCLPMVLPA